jgi:hypothetical protein
MRAAPSQPGPGGEAQGKEMNVAADPGSTMMSLPVQQAQSYFADGSCSRCEDEEQ